MRDKWYSNQRIGFSKRCWEQSVTVEQHLNHDSNHGSLGDQACDIYRVYHDLVYASSWNEPVKNISDQISRRIISEMISEYSLLCECSLIFIENTPTFPAPSYFSLISTNKVKFCCRIRDVQIRYTLYIQSSAFCACVMMESTASEGLSCDNCVLLARFYWSRCYMYNRIITCKYLHFNEEYTDYIS